VISLTDRQRRFAELHCPWVFSKDSFTVPEIAKKLSLNKRTVYGMIAEKKIKSFKATKKTRRISRKAIIIYLMNIS